MFLVPRSERLTLLNGFSALADWVGAIIKLFKVDNTPTLDTTVADLTAIEADYDGYAASSAVVWGSAFLEPLTSDAVSAGGSKTFVKTAGIVTNTVYGWWLESAGGDLLAAGKFDTPLSFVNVGDGYVLTPEIRYGGTNLGEMNVLV